MSRIAEAERLLLNWARWQAGGGAGGLGYASVDMASEGIRATDAEGPRIPVIELDAGLTNQAVMSLESDLRRTVEVEYLQGGGRRQKAQRLCCSEATMRLRLDRADVLIMAWMAQWRETSRARRAHVEQLQAQARG